MQHLRCNDTYPNLASLTAEDCYGWPVPNSTESFEPSGSYSLGNQFLPSDTFGVAGLNKYIATLEEVEVDLSMAIEQTWDMLKIDAAALDTYLWHPTPDPVNGPISLKGSPQHFDYTLNVTQSTRGEKHVDAILETVTTHKHAIHGSQKLYKGGVEEYNMMSMSMGGSLFGTENSGVFDFLFETRLMNDTGMDGVDLMGPFDVDQYRLGFRLDMELQGGGSGTESHLRVATFPATEPVPVWLGGSTYDYYRSTVDYLGFSFPVIVYFHVETPGMSQAMSSPRSFSLTFTPTYQALPPRKYTDLRGNTPVNNLPLIVR